MDAEGFTANIPVEWEEVVGRDGEVGPGGLVALIRGYVRRNEHVVGIVASR